MRLKHVPGASPALRALFLSLLLLLPPAAARAVDEEAATKQFRFAKGLFDREMYAECLEETGKFVDYYKESRLADKGLYLHAETLYRLGRHADAAAAFDRFLAAHPASALAREARYTLAWARLTLKDEKEALRHFRELFDAPDRAMRADARLRAGLLLARAGDAKAAEGALDALARDAQSPANLLAEGLLALAKVRRTLGKAGEAEKTLRLLLKNHPDFPERPAALAALAELLVAARKSKEALPLYRDARKATPPGPAAVRLRHAIAWCRFDLADFAGAAEDFAAVLAGSDGADGKPPADRDLLDEARLARGKALFHAKRYAEALEPLAKAGGAGAAEARFYEGFAHYKMKAHEKALAAFAAVPEKSGESGRLALFYRGVVLFETKRFPEAAAFFTKYLEAGGGDKAELARFNIAQCRLNSNDRPGARAEFEALASGAADAGTRAQARFSLAELHGAEGRVDDAVAALEGVEAKSARRDEALLRAGDLLRAAGRAADALARYRAASSATPEGRTAALRAGKLLAESGDVAGAEAAFALAAKRDDASAREARYELARLARGRGDLAAARAHAGPLLAGGVPFRLEAMNLLAQADLAAGERATAEARLARVIEEGKDGPAAIEARLLLAESCADDGRFDDGLVHAERALGLARSNEEQGRAQYLVGRLREGKGETDRAMRDYLKVEILYRDSASHAPAMLRLAALHLARGKKADASKLLAPLLPALRGEALARAKELLEQAK